MFLDGVPMITCHIKYEVDPDKMVAFEAYARRWIELVPRFGGVHHGYFLPSEGANDLALAIFSFPSLTAYAQYREDAAMDPDVIEANRIAIDSKCFRRYERTFFKPLLPQSQS